MAYFDSAKNRALWQKELAGLKQERARRESMGFAAVGKGKAKGAEDRPGRVRITYAQLEKEEYEAVQAKKVQRAERTRTVSAERSAERSPEASV